MVTIPVQVTEQGVRFFPPVPIVKRDEEIAFELTFYDNTEIVHVEFDEFMVLREDGGEYVEHKSATKDWHKKRGKSRTFDKKKAVNKKVQKKFGARGNIGGSKNRLVKFKVIMTHQTGAKMNVDPILDERPGGI